MDQELEELKGSVDFDFFDAPPNSAKHVRSPSPRIESSKIISKPPPAPKSPKPDSPVNNRESRWILDSENDRDGSGKSAKENNKITTARRTQASSSESDSYSSDYSSESDNSSSFSDVSSVRSGGRARNESRSKSRSLSRSPSPPEVRNLQSKLVCENRPKSRQSEQHHDVEINTKQKVEFSWSNSDSSETDSSETDSSVSNRTPSATPRDRKIRSGCISNSSYNEKKDSPRSQNSAGRARPFSAHPRRRQNGVTTQAWEENVEENNEEASRYTKNKGKSSRHRRNNDDRSHSDSDMTDVSPLMSPRNSPHKRKNDSRNRDNNLPSGSHGKTVQYREMPDESHSSQRLTRGEATETLDLNLLMKAVSELEKKKRVRDNTRHVMFAAPRAQDHSNFTFSSDRTKRIERENQRLLHEIMKHVAEQREPHRVHRVVPEPVRRVTASAINRQKQQRKIESDNLQLLQRLQRIQPSRGMSRNEQISKYKQTMLYGVPIAADDPAMAGKSRRSRPGSAGSSFSQRSRSMNSVHSASTSVSQLSTTRSRRPRSRPTSAYQAVDTRPGWSDRW